MRALRNILSIARYERIMLTRSVRFRFLGFVGIAIPMFFGVVLALAETFGDIQERASNFGFSAFVPFYFYTYTQTALAAFVAGNFRAADENAEVGEVIAARPMSNTVIVLGKYVGTLQALAGLAGFVALLTIGIQAAKLSIMGAPLSFEPYFYYFFIMMLPSLVFVSALTFCIGAIFRNPTLTSLLSVAYGLSVLFYLGHRGDGLLDFGAFLRTAVLLRHARCRRYRSLAAHPIDVPGDRRRAARRRRRGVSAVAHTRAFRTPRTRGRTARLRGSSIHIPGHPKR